MIKISWPIFFGVILSYMFCFIASTHAGIPVFVAELYMLPEIIETIKQGDYKDIQEMWPSMLIFIGQASFIPFSFFLRYDKLLSVIGILISPNLIILGTLLMVQDFDSKFASATYYSLIPFIIMTLILTVHVIINTYKYPIRKKLT